MIQTGWALVTAYHADMRPPLHFFLSYSHEDQALVNGFRDDLQSNGVNLWVDRTDLAPGTPNWERSLRRGLEHAFGLILSATPATINSSAVQAELAFARSLDLPILPVWLDGENWSQSAPLSVTQTQYLDLRRDSYKAGLNQLLGRLKDVEAERKPSHVLVSDAFDSWYDRSSNDAYGFGLGVDSYVTVQLDAPPYDKPKAAWSRDERAVLFNPVAYNSLQAFLDELYSSYLSDTYEPLTYGLSWLLREQESRDSETHGVNPPRLVAPWSWLSTKNWIPTSILQPYWGRAALDQYGLIAGSVWTLMELSSTECSGGTRRDDAFGIAVNNYSLLQEIIHGAGKQPYPPYRAGFLELASYESIDTTVFQHLVVALDIWSGRPFGGKVLRETGRRFDPSQIADY
jgi:hypothetical protein